MCLSPRRLCRGTIFLSIFIKRFTKIQSQHTRERKKHDTVLGLLLPSQPLPPPPPPSRIDDVNNPRETGSSMTTAASACHFGRCESGESTSLSLVNGRRVRAQRRHLAARLRPSACWASSAASPAALAGGVLAWRGKARAGALRGRKCCSDA